MKTRYPSPISGHVCVHQLFEAQVSRRPHAIAILTDDARLTYDDVNQRANQLAHHLITLGVRPEALVGMLLDRTPATLVAMLAIWKAGGAYVPLDPALPLERLHQIAADARPALVIRSSRKVRLDLPGTRIVDLDVDRFLIERQPTENPDPRASPENLAYCVYTSGTTGTPKGVAVAGRGLVNQVTYLTRVLGIRPGDRVLQFTSIAMDAALQEILPAWIGGGTLVVHSERVPSIRQFMALLNHLSVSVVSVPSSYFHLWVSELARVAAQRPRSLRMVFVGGERILAERLRQWRALPWGIQVEWLADYGPTETTLSCMICSEPPEDEWESVPLGRPIPNIQVHVLDARLEPVCPGCVGELYIAGVGVARGYLNRPDLTAERFVCNPFGQLGSRMYRTGDRGYELPDGLIQFVGRNDDQVKINGLRVELGDIQSALLRCAGVRDAVVIARERVPGEIRLIGYVVADSFSEPDVRSRLGELLPTGLIPSALVQVVELVRSPVTGKLDRSKLPDPEAADAHPTLVDGASEIEQSIAALFAAVIGHPASSHDEDFFIAGGDSLRALQLLGRLAEQTGVEVTFTEFVRAATIGSLASFVASASRHGDMSGPTRRPLASRPEIICSRASHAQQRLWFLDRLQPGAAVYSIPLAYRVRGELSVEKLDHALTSIAARHEALRTAFVERDDVLWQVIAPAMAIRSERLEAENFAEALTIANQAAALPFELTRAPLLRSYCIRIAAEEYLYVLNVHHSVFDVWSLGTFWRELEALYTGRSLSPVVLQYADYAEWQSEWLQGAGAENQRAFWRERLDGELPVLGLKRRPAADDASFPSGAMESLLLDAGTKRAVTELSQQAGVTEFAVLLSAFLGTLYRHTREEQIVVGIPAACRVRPETDGIIGYLTNTVALRASFCPELTFLELLDQASKGVSEAIVHQELPFDVVVDSLSLSRQAQRSPVFQAMFVIQDTPLGEAPRLDGLEIEEVAVHSGTAKVDLTCAIRSASSGFQCELEYATAVFDQPAAARFVSSFQCLLSDATRRPFARIDELMMIDAEQQAAAVARINGEFDVYPGLQPLHAGFESWALHSPGSVAIEIGRTTICYGELNRRADLLARRLVANGAGPEKAIGICLDRSIELVISVLATLKSGAAFVPLDPSLPTERLRVISEDAGISMIVTSDCHRRTLADLSIPLIAESPDDHQHPGHHVTLSMHGSAYIYYTSGSTGEPKGVIIDHLCAATRLEWLMRRYQLNQGDHVIHKTPLIFDVAIWEIFLPLSAGATILMVSPGAQGDVIELSELLERQGTVLTHFVPSMLDAYLDLVPQRSYPDLRWVQVSGEAASPRLLERFAEHFSVDLHNMYGQTETSEVAAWEGRATGLQGSVPIGKQIGVYRLFVLDAALGLVPSDLPGELCVAGVGGLARGYHGRPALTAAAFVPNPYAISPGERLYRTGDIVSMDEDGTISYLSRIDEQTKIRGCRVELGEVEAILARHPTIRSCAVVARPSPESTNEIVAYLVGDAISVTELAAHAERFLPTYMLPACYVQLGALPLTPSGKLDRRKLPSPTVADREVRSSHETARTTLERELGLLWKRVLRLEDVGSTDNFFALGGNSLKCLQVLNRVSGIYGVDVSLRAFMSEPTIRGLAFGIEQGLAVIVSSLSDDDAVRQLQEFV
jgi:amino acid adenylation domain-containing protein